MTFSVVIPARYGSSRLPGKPLADIGGKPMLQWVYERASASAAEQVVIATDDARIESAAKLFGARVCMTANTHPSGTDRIEEVARILGLADDTIVVNVQGDEPLLPAAVIDQVAANLSNTPEAAMSTLCEPLENVDEMFNPNVVKVVTDSKQLALYFSRAPIPWARERFKSGQPTAGTAVTAQRHVGIYAYRWWEPNDRQIALDESNDMTDRAWLGFGWCLGNQLRGGLWGRYSDFLCGQGFRLNQRRTRVTTRLSLTLGGLKKVDRLDRVQSFIG